MKVLSLQCAHQHSFEGWFASEDDFRQQLDRGLVSCPVCGDAAVHKLPSAPRLNLAHAREPGADVMPEAAADAADVRMPETISESQGVMLSALRELVRQTEDVGERFADEARAMHHGDTQRRAIRGRTTPQVAIELMEEGIDVLPLPALPALKETLQ